MLEDYLVEKGKVPFKYLERFKSFPTFHQVETREFSDTNDLETFDWFHYCFIYCENAQPFGEQRFYVMREKRSSHYYFTIIEKQEEDKNDNTAGLASAS